MKRQSKHQHQIKTQILELTDLELKSNMKTMLRILIEKVDNIQEQMSNISKEVETLRRSQKRSDRNLGNFSAILT